MNQSEKQLKEFLEFKKEGGFGMKLKLTPQGNEITVSHDESINLCEVHIGKDVYCFGGISEVFFDNMYMQYETEDIEELKEYSIPITWESYKRYTVKAGSLEKAIEVALKEFFKEPDPHYIDDSFEVDHEIIMDEYDEDFDLYNAIKKAFSSLK